MRKIYKTYSIAPIVGIAKRKLNLEAAVGLNPINKAAVIVIPDLEVPGTRARHWNKPIIKAWKGLKENSSFSWVFFWAMKSNKPNRIVA